MPIDPRTPVLVGYGQVNERNGDPAVEPVDLMERAARAAADPRVLEAVDSVRVVNLLSWRYRNPGLLLAQRIRAQMRRADTPASAETCPSRWSIRRVWTLRGATSTRCSSRAPRRGAPDQGTATGGKLDWTKEDESVPVPQGAEDSSRWRPAGDPDQAGPAGLRLPDVRAGAAHRRGETADEHRRRIGELWARFSAVARDNPHAWSRDPVSPQEIWRAGPRQPNDQLALHQADELQQHGRPGCGADPDVGGEGDVPADPFGALGFPVCGHRCARHLCDRRARGVPPFARDPDRGLPGARAGRRRRRRPRPGRRLLVFPVGGAGGRQRTRAADSATSIGR